MNFFSFYNIIIIGDCIIIIILGQPRTGKTILATEINKKLNYKMISMDKERWNLGYYSKKYETQIHPLNQNRFERHIKSLVDGDTIIEGMEIHPDRARKRFKDAIIVMLCRKNMTVGELVEDCRKYDRGSYTNYKSNEAMIKSLIIHNKVGRKWANQTKEKVFDTTDFEKGLTDAYNYIMSMLDCEVR